MKKDRLIIGVLALTLCLSGCTNIDTSKYNQVYESKETEPNDIKDATVSDNQAHIDDLLLAMEDINDGGIPGSTYSAYFYQGINRVKVDIKGTNFSSAPDVEATDFNNTVYITQNLYNFIKNAYDMNIVNKDTWAFIIECISKGNINIVLSNLTAECYKDLFDENSYIQISCTDIDLEDSIYLLELNKTHDKYFISHLTLDDGGFPSYTKEIENSIDENTFIALSDITNYPWVFLEDTERNEYFQDFIVKIKEEGLEKAIATFEDLYPIQHSAEILNNPEQLNNAQQDITLTVDDFYNVDEPFYTIRSKGKNFILSDPWFVSFYNNPSNTNEIVGILVIGEQEFDKRGFIVTQNQYNYIKAKYDEVGITDDNIEAWEYLFSTDATTKEINYLDAYSNLVAFIEKMDTVYPMSTGGETGNDEDRRLFYGQYDWFDKETDNLYTIEDIELKPTKEGESWTQKFILHCVTFKNDGTLEDKIIEEITDKTVIDSLVSINSVLSRGTEEHFNYTLFMQELVLHGVDSALELAKNNIEF